MRVEAWVHAVPDEVGYTGPTILSGEGLDLGVSPPVADRFLEAGAAVKAHLGDEFVNVQIADDGWVIALILNGEVPDPADFTDVMALACGRAQDVAEAAGLPRWHVVQGCCLGPQSAEDDGAFTVRSRRVHQFRRGRVTFERYGD